MPKIYIVNEIISEMMKQYAFNNNELESLKNELMYKSTRELENMLEKLEDENRQQDGTCFFISLYLPMENHPTTFPH